MRRKRAQKDGDIGTTSISDGRIPMVALVQTLAVAEYLSFRHAAHALGVSQSSVSERVKTLEQNLGVILFERNTRGVRLTAAGRLFVEQVTEGVNQLDYAVKMAGMAASGGFGRLRIGVHALIAGSFLTELIERFHRAHPRIEIEVTEGTARDAVMQLRSHRLDIVFLAGTPELPDCHSRQLWTEPLLVALPHEHRLAVQAEVSWDDLAGETFLVRHGGSGPEIHNHIMTRLAGRWPTPSILRFDVERYSLFIMIRQGFGITILGAAALLRPVPGLVFRPIADEPVPVSFSAVWSPSNRSETLRKLLGLACDMGKSI